MDSRILRKALTKPIWWYETSRSYSVRDRAFSLPPLSTNAAPSTVLLVLTTPTTIPDAVWAAQSMIRNLPDGIGLLLVVDGKIKPEEEAAIRNVFPNVLLEQTSALCDALRPIAPNVVALSESHPLGRKLATILSGHHTYNIVYSDADVLCFGPAPELCKAVNDLNPPMYLQDVKELNSDGVLLAHINSLSYSYAQTLNSGLLFIPKGSLRLASAEAMLRQGCYDVNSWFIEQTVMAALMQEAGAQPLPRSRYVVSCQRQFYFEKDVDYEEIAVRHFISPVRHLMYSRGMSILAQQLLAG